MRRTTVSALGGSATLSPRRPLGGAGGPVEFERVIPPSGNLGAMGRQVLAAEILGGHPVIIRIEPATLIFLDP